MRGLTKFESDELVTIEGVDYRFHSLVRPISPRPNGSDDLQFLDVRHRRVRILTPEELYALYCVCAVRLHRIGVAQTDQGPDDAHPQKTLLRRWRLYWTETYDLSPVKKSTPKLNAFIEQYRFGQPDPIQPPSPHTLRTWLRERGQPDDRRPSDMGNRRRTNVARRSIHPEVQAIWDRASRHYWTSANSTPNDVAIEVRAAVLALDDARKETGYARITPPGRTTVYRWLKQERTWNNFCSKEGRRAADREFKAIRGSLEAKHLLDVTIIDHKRMDVHVVDEATRTVIGRPWLVVMIDVKSRMILGYFLTFEEPSILSAMACVRMGLRGFPDLKDQFPTVEGSWEAFGLCQVLLVDNAWENTGSSLIDSCKDLGITIKWAPVRSPQYKGIVERFFGRLDQQFVHKLPGAVPDKPYELAKRGVDPRTDAVLTLAELNELVARYIVDVYSID